MLAYLSRGPVVVSDEIFQNAVRLLEPSRGEEIMASFGHGHFLRGYAEGEANGEARGKVQALTLMLEGRFGPLPTRLSQRISTADLASIEAWLRLVIQAPDLQSVFGRDS
jgi:hypothetical protein